MREAGYATSHSALSLPHKNSDNSSYSVLKFEHYRYSIHELSMWVTDGLQHFKVKLLQMWERDSALHYRAASLSLTLRGGPKTQFRHSVSKYVNEDQECHLRFEFYLVYLVDVVDKSDMLCFSELLSIL